jgi:hypothetical protein
MPGMNDLPDNGGFQIAGYVVTTIIYLGYTVSLLLRARKAEEGQR